MIPDFDLSEFDYELPEELIAQAPAARRSASRLLHLDAQGALHDRQFKHLPDLLTPGDVLVFNNTRVIKARLTGRKDSGGKVEVLIERITGEHTALAHIRSSKAPRPGTALVLDGPARACVQGRDGEFFALQFEAPVQDVLERHGTTPLPPYITRHADDADLERYQTVYATQPGAVAAPTAGLHFDDAMLATLAQSGIQCAFVTLHVGAGTFQPVRAQRISQHQMHAERFSVPAETLEQIERARRLGGRVVAVGTTSARALEAAVHDVPPAGAPGVSGRAAEDGCGLAAHREGDTRLFITPGYRFRMVDALLTNFHLPQSTLLMMVSALAGMQPVRRAYAHAVAQRYRFFSYGDAMFIERPVSRPRD